MQLWREELLPSIRQEIKQEVESINTNIEALKCRCEQIEKSQDFLSTKYDKFVETLQGVKKQINGTETKVKNQDEAIKNVKINITDLSTQLDELQQYTRRDCLEINGIPSLPDDDPEQLVMELTEVIGVQLIPDHISIAHRLPANKNNRPRIIVKFTQRTKKEEFYRMRKKLIGKTTKNLPSVASNLEDGYMRGSNKIYINESLTAYRKKLFGKVNAFKKEMNYKFLWTVNGKILLKESEQSRTFAFSTLEEFDLYASSVT